MRKQYRKGRRLKNKSDDKRRYRKRHQGRYAPCD